MTRRIVPTLTLLLATSPTFGVEHLCPPPAPLPEGRDDFRIKEDEITAKNYRESMDYLRKELPKRIQALPPGSNVDAIEGFWLSYSNSLSFIEGHALKTAALLERARRPGKTNGPAERRFCAWLQKAEYVD
jgi:hypothetical protein